MPCNFALGVQMLVIEQGLYYVHIGKRAVSYLEIIASSILHIGIARAFVCQLH